ncbi:unnamed protein product [Cyberlindnera jadinii]|uniref:Uncharacterized protein n=1 Tax=Cyberlindnera jadinii (strain ATCC 18201 / CBS 1600 / BCRC 20928 / JCM 3617 / NBRC 0987 / NRRL Y-1542) TaxID=983966 RepID=A0A0H5C4K6_CYBJN|nr:unnamed protein product [Cyberlindnera jadinii]
MFSFKAISTLAFSLGLIQAKSLPMADAIPAAKAAADAYAEAYSEAIALGHPEPEAFALAASADDCATFQCHAVCGTMIIAAQGCSMDQSSFTGPYTEDCICSDPDSTFMDNYNACMDCGWTLWKYYGPYLTAALEQCQIDVGTSTDIATEPTGTSRCSTTLSSSYSLDPNINYSTYLA